MNPKIIAEVGWNHMGDMDLAANMIESAASSGADIVKFQTWFLNDLMPGPWDNDGRREIYENAELSYDDHKFLIKKCEENNVEFLTSVFSINGLKMIRNLNLKMIKIPSHEINNIKLIDSVNQEYEKILLSAGACTWEELNTSIKYVEKSKLVVMHCVSAYPCNPENINFQKLNEIKSICNTVGYSGHYKGIEDAICSIVLGAKYIEKHFTIDNNLPGRDNKNAILPKDLAQLKSFRDIYSLMMINKGLDVQNVEEDIRDNYRQRWSKNDT